MFTFHQKRVAVSVLSAGILLQSVSCGTILHPERRGQPPGRLDPGIVVLDAVGLIFFFIPGIIAFAVDFSNGTIYLPPEYSSADVVPAEQLRTVRLSPNELTPQRLEQAIQEQTGRTIRLEHDGYRATRLERIGDWNAAKSELESDRGAGRVRFSGKSE
jgi:hypothetical protein